jgi:uncharacterized protein YggE
MQIHRIVFPLLAVLGLGSFMTAQTIQISRDNKSVAISTTDEAAATADIAAITIGFEIYGPDSAQLADSGGRLSRAILDAVRSFGITDKEIESSNQGIQRNNNFDEKDSPDERAQKRFMFHQSWIVSAPPELAAKVIQAAISNGANMSGAIEWRLADRKALQAKAAAMP